MVVKQIKITAIPLQKLQMYLIQAAVFIIDKDNPSLSE